MKRVIIMRGLPGSGKSFYLKKHYPDACVCSADHFFEDESGKYHFDPSKLNEAHKACLGKFLGLLQAGESIVCVDNTNMTSWEMSPYRSLANLFGYGVTIVRVLCTLENAIERNVHDVPDFVFERMINSMEEIPECWSLIRTTFVNKTH